MATQTQLRERFSLDIPAHMVEDAEVPVLAGRQRQGDLYLVPMKSGGTAGSQVPAAGVALIRGEALGNTHLLLPSPGVTYRPVVDQSAGEIVGMIDVADGAIAYFHHIEHGYVAMCPGSYLVRRQREQRDLIRLVVD